MWNSLSLSNGRSNWFKTGSWSSLGSTRYLARKRLRFVEIMRHAIALNGAFFDTHRMMQQYATKAYFR